MREIPKAHKYRGLYKDENSNDFYRLNPNPTDDAYFVRIEDNEGIYLKDGLKLRVRHAVNISTILSGSSEVFQVGAEIYFDDDNLTLYINDLKLIYLNHDLTYHKVEGL